MYREDVVLLHLGITEFSALNHKAEFTFSSESLSYSRTPTFFTSASLRFSLRPFGKSQSSFYL